MEKDYAVLGMHGADVPEVNIYKDAVDADGKVVLDGEGNPVKELFEVRNVARVRMFVDGQMIDEDFTLPRLITVEEQIESAVTARIEEIKKLGTDPAKSAVVDTQTEQIVEEIK